MSAGSIVLVSGVIGLPLSGCGWNMDLSFLKETQRVDSLRRCDGERKEESLDGAGRKMTEARMSRREIQQITVGFFLDTVGPTPCIVL